MDLFLDRAAKPMQIGRTIPAFDDEEYLFEIKLDGERCLAYLDNGVVDLINRRGNRLLARLPELGEIHGQAKGRCILDGELVVVRDGKPDFDEMMRRNRTKNVAGIELLRRQFPVTLVVFDILYLKGEDLTGKPLLRRKQLLADTVQENDRISLSRYVHTQGEALYNSAVEHGLEGVVGKRIDSRYHMGKRTGDWVKCKHTQDDDFVICGYICEAAYVASLVLGQYNAAGELVFKGYASLALSGADFARIAKLPKRKTRPFKEPPPEGDRGAQWVEPRLVCTVQYLSLGPTGFMRHPVYKGLRADKTPQEAVQPGVAGPQEIQPGNTK